MKATRDSEYNSIFASKLRDLLEQKSISRTKLASVIGVKQQTVSLWADGSTTPKLEHLKPLASYFEISIDELVTGVAPDNEAIHLDTGLSNLAIEILKRLNSDNKNKSKNIIIIEFLNVIIESMDSKVYSLSRLARLCMDYIVGAHGSILEQEELKMEQQKGMVHLVHIDRPNMKNDNLDFRTYQLTKDFEYFIEHLTKKPKIAERVKRVYIESALDLPDFSDSRFSPGAFSGGNNPKDIPIKAKISVEDSESEDDATNTSPK